MAKIEIPGFQVARSGQLTPGKTYAIWLHSNPQTEVSKAKLISRPNCAVRDMSPTDEYVFRTFNENGNLTKNELRLRRNSTFPHYLVTTVPGIKPGTVKTSRMSILEAVEETAE